MKNYRIDILSQHGAGFVESRKEYLWYISSIKRLFSKEKHQKENKNTFTQYLSGITKKEKIRNLFWWLNISLRGCLFDEAAIVEYLSLHVYNKPISSWLVRLYDFYYALVVKDCQTHSFATLTRSFAIFHNSCIKMVRAHQPWSNLFVFRIYFLSEWSCLCHSVHLQLHSYRCGRTRVWLRSPQKFVFN